MEIANWWKCWICCFPNYNNLNAKIYKASTFSSFRGNQLLANQQVNPSNYSKPLEPLHRNCVTFNSFRHEKKQRRRNESMIETSPKRKGWRRAKFLPPGLPRLPSAFSRPPYSPSSPFHNPSLLTCLFVWLLSRCNKKLFDAPRDWALCAANASEGRRTPYCHSIWPRGIAPRHELYM